MSRALGIALGFAADRAFGDPRRLHPVAGFGTIAAHLENTWYVDSRARGTAYTLTLVGAATAAGVALERRGPLVRTMLTALVTWAVLGGRSLDREALAVEALIGDLPAARQRLTHLVGRETVRLDESEIARAVVESVAENTSDAVVAPLFWGAIAGIPGLLGYRAANTLDAMVGHRTPRHARFGWASARLDDLLNLPASRLTASLAALLGERPRSALRAWRSDAHRHPSPNAGPVEAAFAGALGVRLGGSNSYAGATEDRGFLGDGGAVEPGDIRRATALSSRIGLGALAIAIGLALKPRGSRQELLPES